VRSRPGILATTLKVGLASVSHTPLGGPHAGCGIAHTASRPRCCLPV
jgi:hypothetical protein